MSQPNIISDIEALLNESKEFFEEAMIEERREIENTGEEESPSWFQKFSENIKSSISEPMKEKLSNVKVKLTPIRDKEEQIKETKEDVDKLTKTNYAAHCTNLLAKVVRRVQKLVVNHGVALAFLQELLNTLEVRIANTEAKITVTEGWIETELDSRLEAKLATMEAKVLKIEEEKEQLKVDVDTSRQWGMKGNLILSTKVEDQGLLEPRRDGGGNESLTAMCRRLIQNKTGVEIKEEDILACHTMGKAGKKSCIIKIHNHKAGTGWETLVAGMQSGWTHNGPFADTGIFINFQLTERRNDILYAVRKGRRADHFKKFKVDPNGRIWISKVKGQPGIKSTLPWQEVTSIQRLLDMFPGMEEPAPRDRQRQRS